MTMKKFAVPALALFLGATGLGTARAHGATGTPSAAAYGQERGWDAPPEQLNETERRGFRDGLEGAHKDFDNHRRPDVNNRDEYRDPELRGELREAYREGFRRGYERGMAHFWGGPGGPVGVESPVREREGEMREQGGWDMPPGEFNESQRRGFHEGVEAARRDFESHRRPDVDDHEEFRHPNLPGELADAFRDGFRRGYQTAISHLMGSPDQPMPPPEGQMREAERGGWDAPPGEFNEFQRRGFRDGMEGARKDFENHRRPDVENRDEFRTPRVEPDMRGAYREGFRRGYEVTMSHLMGAVDRR